MPTSLTLSPRHVRAGALAALSAVALAAPAAAQAGTVAVDRSCYAEGAPVIVGGSGFSPGSTVAISGNGFYGSAPVLPNGQFVYTGNAPTGFSVNKPGAKTVSFTVTDSNGLTSTGSLRVAPLATRTRPSRANPRRRVKWVFSGFPQGSTIYGHVSRGGRTFNHRFGRAQGPCGILKTRARLLPIPARSVRLGLYRIQIDNSPSLTTGALPRLEFLFRVYRTYR